MNGRKFGVGEPISALFVALFNKAGLGIAFAPVLVMWILFSLAGTVLYRAYVSPITKEKFGALKNEARATVLSEIPLIVGNDKRLRRFVPIEVENLLPLWATVWRWEARNMDAVKG